MASTNYSLTTEDGDLITCFKRLPIVPMPKNKPSCLNNYRPIALTSVVMKVFDRLLKNIISSYIPSTTDLLQFAY